MGKRHEQSRDAIGYAVQGHTRRTGHSGVLTAHNPPRAGTGKPLQYLGQENSMYSNKRLKDMMLEDEPLRLEGVQHVTEEEQRTRASSTRATYKENR